MSDITWVRTCKNCGHDNADDAGKCNYCAKSLTGGFNDKYHRRWACPSCSTLNMAENVKCLCGFKKGGGGPGFLEWIGIVFGGMVLLSMCSK